MQPNFAFYIHHHGSGHFMRALAIARRLSNAQVTFLGSNLKRFQSLLPAHINCVHLPMDVPIESDTFATSQKLDFLHYAPLNVWGLLERSEMIVKTLKASFPIMLIVDVSVEVTMLATLVGVPTIVIRQNGNRDDVAHLNAYQSAQMLLAPCPQILVDQSAADWVERKTFYSGGFCRYDDRENLAIPPEKGKIGIIIGAGGTSIDCELVKAIARQCQPSSFHLIGEMSIHGSAKFEESNIIYHGAMGDPAGLLADCEVVIGNAGHNTVMEMAALNKRFICITEERPFHEQVRKGALLQANNMAIVLDHHNLDLVDWPALIQKAQNLSENGWQGVINPNALDAISEQLFSKWEEIFSSK
ncbi:UDP-N-acetylglucosamine--N-acetylmuramyl-(pentapeptide) pyrophosphoryl-undecaprenol N-acetylglucosamine transferase [Dyadobacter arcticus]|uniref:Glycosyltransferase n=1 Tax=Dyadobacter arcticus TaxID=1078754 RepID=A0ABX0UH21_9BACT|nr:UDP-N-acetylglucosamine--N-acetylmuramyl-(pentapeptide) pyrophosphoryl-undecaprenol N-acetylglucosamine transferase [Dyadobacter arcticus]NIJ51010.1 putative glycosyltransferase [Dyadobacter arcticus]